MNLTQLEIFKAVAEEGTISAAAERLHRVPSNLTTRLQQLEGDLGVDLFIREKRRLRLSATGRSFLDYSRRILDLVDEARESTRGGSPRGPFTLGSLESTAAVRIPTLLADFHHHYPAVELDLSTGPSGEMLDGVLAGRLGAAFIDGPIEHPELDGLPVFDEELVVIASRSHLPVARARDVAGENIYAFRANCSYRRHFENWFAQDATAPGKIFEIESYHGMLACVSAGAGLAMVPRSMLDRMVGHDEVTAYSLDAPFRHAQIWLFWRRNSHSACLTALIDMCRQRRTTLA